MGSIPTSAHNEALSGDTLYSAFLNYEWREILMPFIIAGLEGLAATIDDESDKQDFEVLYGALIEDLYDAENMDFTPVGVIMAWTTFTPPTKWKICNGEFLAEADYPELFALIGDTFNASPPSNYFGLPDLRERFIYGSNDIGSPSDINGSGGAATHTLSLTEIPSHTHTQTTRGTGGANPRFTGDSNGNATVVNNQLTLASGGGAAHNNMPPYKKLSWIIKALP